MPSGTLFAAATGPGVVHTAGTPLAILPGQAITGTVTISDPVTCQGTISASFGGTINLTGGLTLSGTGAVNLGYGNLTTNNSISEVSGGSLTAASEFVASSGTGTFVQTGGANAAGSLYVGTSGQYQLAGGTLQVNGTLQDLGVFEGGGSAAR